MRRTFSILLAVGFLLLPAAAGAVDWLPIVPCGGAGQPNCTPCDLFVAVGNLFDLVLYGITGPLAAFMIVLAGGMMLLGGGNPKMFGQGKAMLENTLIGVTIILLSWAATTFLVKTFIRTGEGDRWFEFSCPASLSSAVPPIETTIVMGQAPPVPPSTYQVENLGVAVLGQGGGSAAGSGEGGGAAGLCRTGACKGTSGTCPKLSQFFRNRTNGRLLEYIAWHESGCRINIPGKTGDFGLMQLVPRTANLHKNGCEVVEKDANGNMVDVTITGAWLMSEKNVEKVVCIADNYINSLKGACGNEVYHLIGGYNGGPGVCRQSSHCPGIQSCVGNQSMRVWECPWNNRAHTIPNTGYEVTRNYAAEAVACLR